ncbi:MAG TPA: autotransporter-associated beta strand repeat-containing protein [Chthoniobacteraceae bacterium]|nr:autotransporter-associated beta strand repeat-containing protein [Chthoniobacteraceae bacterium]
MPKLTALIAILSACTMVASLKAESYSASFSGNTNWSDLEWTPAEPPPGNLDSVSLTGPGSGSLTLNLEGSREFVSMSTKGSFLMRSDGDLDLGTLRVESGSLFLANGSGGILSVTVGNVEVTGSSTSFFLGRNGAGPVDHFTVTGTTTLSGMRLAMQAPTGTINLGRLVNQTQLDLANSTATNGSAVVVNVRGITGGGEVITSNNNATVRPTLRITGMEVAAVETFSGSLTDGGAGTASKVKLEMAGPGTQVLSRAQGNTYSGGTLVSGGTLAVTNTSGSGLGTGGVEVNGSGVLGGTGRIALAGGETVSVATGGTVAPGLAASSQGGVLTLAGTTGSSAPILEMASGSRFIFRLGTAGESDRIAFTNYQSDGLSLASGGVELDLETLGGLNEPAGDYTLFTFDQITELELAALVARLEISTGSSFTGVLNTTFSDHAGTIFVTAQAIPEPALLSSLAGGGLLLWLAGRGNRRQRGEGNESFKG